MYRNDTLPSGRNVDYFLDNLRYNAYPKAKSFVKALLKGYSIVFKEDFEGLGCMDHQSKTIILNPLQYLTMFDPYYEIIISKYPDDWYSRVNNALVWGFLGIVSHEIGHALYTLPISESIKLIDTNKVPEYFAHFCSNVVEDSYIQNQMKARFKWDLLRNGLDMSTALFQGLSTCEEFEKKTAFTPHDKMFYFILVSYNPNFAKPKGCDIPDALIEEFLSFYYISDAADRYKHTLVWAEHMYEFLKDELQKEDQQNQGSNQGSSQGSGQGSGQGQTNTQGKGNASNSGNSQGNSGGSGTGSGSGGSKTDAELEQALKDIIDALSKSTGIGNGEDKTVGDFNQDSFHNDTVSSLIGLCNGILKVQSDQSVALSHIANSVLSSYNINFRRLQVYSFNGTAYNQSSGKLYQSKIYKSDITTKIFTRDTGRKRDMDLYFGITLDASASMCRTYPILVDMIVPLLHSLNSIKSKSEMLIFSDETVKVKDYFDTKLSNLYSTALKYNFGGGTELLPSLKYFLSIIRERNHKDKCIIVVTDGQSDNMQECGEAIRALRKFNTCVVGVGLKLGEDPTWFKELFGEDVLLYNSDESIQQNIASDLINYLLNRFMRR